MIDFDANLKRLKQDIAAAKTVPDALAVNASLIIFADSLGALGSIEQYLARKETTHEQHDENDPPRDDQGSDCRSKQTKTAKANETHEKSK